MKAQRDLGVPIPAEAIKDYERVRDRVNLAAIAERERVTLHDVKARIEEFSDLAKRQFIHLGLTSRDLTENVEQLQISARSSSSSSRPPPRCSPSPARPRRTAT